MQEGSLILQPLPGLINCISGGTNADHSSRELLLWKLSHSALGLSCVGSRYSVKVVWNQDGLQRPCRHIRGWRRYLLPCGHRRKCEVASLLACLVRIPLISYMIVFRVFFLQWSKNCEKRLLDSPYLSVCAPEWNISATTGRFLHKIWYFGRSFFFSKNLYGIFKFH